MNSTLLALALAAGPTVSPDPEFSKCLDGVRVQAVQAGVSPQIFDQHVRTVTPDPSLLGFLDAQPEFTTPIWDYLASLVDEERVEDGRKMLDEHASTLARVYADYGVDPGTVVAVWGVESNFGRSFGKRPLLTSLTTLSCMGRRQPFFRGELVSTLQIIQSGDVAAEDLVGSWAGAFGHTQFMPSTFQRVAVDFDGDGRRDLVRSIPDALASTARYLKQAGWRTGEPWGFEVKLPPGFDSSNSGRKNRRPIAEWIALGVQPVAGGSISATAGRAALLLPAGAKGPAFLVFKNFDAIYAYNASESYALAIAHLADRLRGQGPFRQPWPTDDPGLARVERRELQSLLLARGHEIGEVDGIIGAASRAAIQAEQARLGMLPVDGRAGQKILRALRNSVAPSGSTLPASPPGAPANEGTR